MLCSLKNEQDGMDKVKPLHIILFHREHWYRQAPRIDGQFAYPVPQFTWEHHNLNKGFEEDLFDYRQFDIAWLDEGKYKSYSRFIPNAPHTTYLCPSVAMYVLYPTLNSGHYTRRVERAKLNADLVLIDHDDLERWKENVRMPVRRLAYSVNERYYCDRGYERDIDVGFYYITAFNKERPALDMWLRGFCNRKGYTYHSTKGKSVGMEYAELLARTKVVIHMNRTPQTRPPRIFDVAASGACLLSNPMPRVSGEGWTINEHYYEFKRPFSAEYAEFEPNEIPVYTDEDCFDLRVGLEVLLGKGLWEMYAQQAKQYVLSCHTWEHRAKQLYTILLDVFPKLHRGREDWMFS